MPCTFYPVSPSGNILQNDSTNSQPGCLYSKSDDTAWLHLHKDSSCCPFFATIAFFFPPIPTLGPEPYNH